MQTPTCSSKIAVERVRKLVRAKKAGIACANGRPVMIKLSNARFQWSHPKVSQSRVCSAFFSFPMLVVASSCRGPLGGRSRFLWSAAASPNAKLLSRPDASVSAARCFKTARWMTLTRLVDASEAFSLANYVWSCYSSAYFCKATSLVLHVWAFATEACWLSAALCQRHFAVFFTTTSFVL